VTHGPVLTHFFSCFSDLPRLDLGWQRSRLFSPLGPFSAMNDVYAWGIWKTFNVMTLTASRIGAAGLA